MVYALRIRRSACYPELGEVYLGCQLRGDRFRKRLLLRFRHSLCLGIGDASGLEPFDELEGIEGDACHGGSIAWPRTKPLAGRAPSRAHSFAALNPGYDV